MESMLRRDLEFFKVTRKHFPNALPTKLIARILRCYMFTCIVRTCGRRAGLAFADAIRYILGKPPLWTKLADTALQSTGLRLPSEVDKIRVSLVVATINRIAPLRRLLQSLREQSHTTFEILLADQNPPGFLDALLNDFQDLTLHVRSISPCGVSAARNAVLGLATGDIIAFPDDDCFYEPDTLASVIRFFIENPAIEGVLGHWSPPDTTSAQAHSLPDAAVTRYSAFRRGETHVQFYRCNVVQVVGDFDETLGPGTKLPYGCGEDTDYLLRALKADFAVHRSCAIRTHHPAPEIADETYMVAKMLSYGRGRMRLLRKHGFPLWFKLANVAYPLTSLLKEGPRMASYRLVMFRGRFIGLLERKCL